MKIGLYSITYLGCWYRGEALSLPEIIRTAKNFLLPGGQLWLETGIDHALRVKDLAKDQGYSVVNLERDHLEQNRFAQLIA